MIETVVIGFVFATFILSCVASFGCQQFVRPCQTEDAQKGKIFDRRVKICTNCINVSKVSSKQRLRTTNQTCSLRRVTGRMMLICDDPGYVGKPTVCENKFGPITDESYHVAKQQRRTLRRTKRKMEFSTNVTI